MARQALLAFLILGASPGARALDRDTMLGYLRYHARELNGFEEEKARMALVKVELGPIAHNSNAFFDGMLERAVLNERLVDASASMLAGCAHMPEGFGAEWVLAIHLLPAYLHELRHAHIQAVLGDTSNSLEEETAGFITTMGVYEQAKARWPEAYGCGSLFSQSDYRIRQTYWVPEGAAGLEQMLKESRFYGAACSVRSVADRTSCRDAARVHWEQVRPLHERLGHGEDPAAACSALSGRLGGDGCHDKDSALRVIWDAMVARAFWNSEATVNKAVAHFNGVELPRGAALHAAPPPPAAHK